ncbi:hypothetical protein IT777_08620 [Klebsiella quasipneumoniae]|uniref:hypothetical protein n=1 Tax=Klebsiella quasipneumoniae TaxID=1463165 RepID=UPI000E2AB181|nr:hypothetical protein [Klebsiella quasipneumoniae]HCI6120911.1 hypothetical protein [Klebsiella quasipneumoniae subsp. quasipneumoniae]MBC9925031.1 hypothetical protein [Klebsiella quasipneumoniae]MBC9941790.1 hypothetical protein [Klebsiella quasipneumoniae]MBC9951999.1 hypothetical protein [Klebsiella quasipneumoniae]QQX97808.1 hypothetical protein IT777_08620 [Klebsiella quasipneumoniae]
MSAPLLRSYNAVIEYTLSRAKKSKTSRRIAGFCQLQGPTGSGKTSSLYRPGHEDNALPALESIKKAGFQAILVTHRWNILHDIYEKTAEHKDSNGEPFRVSVLYAQEDQIVSAVEATPLPHEKNLSPASLPNPFTSIDELHATNLFACKDTAEKLRKSCNNILRINRTLKNYHPQFRAAIASEKEALINSCTAIEITLIQNIKSLEKEVKKQKEKYGEMNELTQAAKQRLDDFRRHAWVRRILPAIAWRDEKQHLLIMTTQKLVSSFFDGRRKVRMSSKELRNHIIFIDEFDYQAEVLQEYLAQAQWVQEPPECLGQLLDGGRRLLQRMQHVATEPAPMIRVRLAEFLENLDNTLVDKDIDLTHARSLVMPLQQYLTGESFGEHYLFRSDHLVTSERLIMRKAEHGYEIIKPNALPQDNESIIDISDFLRLMEKFIRQFNLMLTDLTASEDEAHEYIKKLTRLLFDPVNDYRPSYYGSTLPNMSRFLLPRTDLPELRELRKSNILPNTHASIFGLTNWLLKQNIADIDIDPLRIQIKRAFLPTTAEGLLLSLASRNLVFALSATSYIERACNHFDVRWINSALRYIAEARNPTVTESFLGTTFENRPDSWFKEPIPYVQTDGDIQLQNIAIEEINSSKENIRKTQLNTEIHDFNKIKNSPHSADLLASLPPDFFQNDDEPLTDFESEYRQNILLKLLDVLDLAGKRPQHRGHLAFVNSISYLRKWLTTAIAAQSRDCLTWLKLDPPLSDNLLLKNFTDVFIPVTIHNEPALICLLTAECQKKEGFSDAYQAAFDSRRTVIVLTQTASATNGVNLDFSLPESGKNMDLTCLYLLESRHYYFSAFQASANSNDDMAHAGFQLRNLEKLLRAGEISRKQHQRFVLPLMLNRKNEISRLNGEYKRTSDYIKNTAANVQQQVGRIERAWCEVPNAEIHLDSELAKHLSRFASLPIYTSNRRQLSALNRQLLDTLRERDELTQNNFFSQLMTPTQPGKLALDYIDQRLVPAIRLLREQSTPRDDIPLLWRQLGKAVLQHDLAWEPGKNAFDIDLELYKWACFEKPKLANTDGKIWYSPQTWQFFDKAAEGLLQYNPQRLYQYIQRHPVITDWFNRKGYRTSIMPFANDLEERYAFHPLVVQRLLMGRLGEEAIRALLYSESIITTSQVSNHRLFEQYDFSIKNSDYRVDAKFWRQDTLDKADEEYQQWLASGANQEHTPLGLSKKLAQIRAIEGNKTRLVIANFVAPHADSQLLGFSHQLTPVQNPYDADILILGGCVTPDTISVETPGFGQLKKVINQNIMERA